MSKAVALSVKSHQKKLWQKIRYNSKKYLLILWVSGGRRESTRYFFFNSFLSIYLWLHIKENQEVCSAKLLTRKELESLYYFHFLPPALNNSKDVGQFQTLIPNKKSREMDGIWRLGIKREGEMTRIKILEREKGVGPKMKEAWISNLIPQGP